MAVYCRCATAVTFSSIRLAAVRLLCSVLSQAHTSVPSGEMQVNQTRCSELELRRLSPPSSPPRFPRARRSPSRRTVPPSGSRGSDGDNSRVMDFFFVAFAGVKAAQLPRDTVIDFRAGWGGGGFLLPERSEGRLLLRRRPTQGLTWRGWWGEGRAEWGSAGSGSSAVAPRRCTVLQLDDSFHEHD